MVLLVVVVCLCVLGVQGLGVPPDVCFNISGMWMNSLGSVLSLSVDGSMLGGSFKTSVETSPGAAGEHMIGKVVGVVGCDAHPTFAMSVSWHGGSVSTWAGQCYQGLEYPVLKTIWLLRSQAGTEENWMATRIGEDTFQPLKKSDTN